MNYFQQYDNFEKQYTGMFVGMTSYNDYEFIFSDLLFNNGVRIFLLNEDKIKEFANYMNINKVVKYAGKLENLLDRVTMECLNRTSDDIIRECRHFAENKEFIILCAPFKLSYEENPLDELRDILSNVK